MTTRSELSEIEQKIYDKVTGYYTEKNKLYDGEYLCDIIKLGNVHGDGYKRVSLMDEPGKTYLVPLEDIILFGLKADDLKTGKYLQMR